VFRIAELLRRLSHKPDCTDKPSRDGKGE